MTCVLQIADRQARRWGLSGPAWGMGRAARTGETLRITTAAEMPSDAPNKANFRRLKAGDGRPEDGGPGSTQGAGQNMQSKPNFSTAQNSVNLLPKFGLGQNRPADSTRRQSQFVQRRRDRLSPVCGGPGGRERRLTAACGGDIIARSERNRGSGFRPDRPLVTSGTGNGPVEVGDRGAEMSGLSFRVSTEQKSD